MYEAVEQIHESLECDIGIEHILVKFRGKKVVPGVIYVAQSVSSVFHPQALSPTATRLNVMIPKKFSKNKFTDSVDEVISELNHYMQLAN